MPGSFGPFDAASDRFPKKRFVNGALAKSALLLLVTSLAIQAQIHFSTPVRYDFGLPLTGYSLAVADLNHDGRQDLVVPTDSGVAVFLNRGDGTLPPPALYAVPGTGSIGVVAVEDFNRDGWQDVALASGANVSILLNRGDGTLGLPAAYPVSIWLGAGGMATGDFNRDGYPDLIVTFVGDTDDQSQMFLNAGDGTFQPLDVKHIGYGRVLTADLNNDGYADIISHESITTFLNSRHPFTESNWDTIFSPTDICGGCFFGLFINHNDTGFVAADLTGDGYPDIISGVDGAGDQTPLSLYVNNGHGGFGPNQGAQTGPWRGHILGLVAADFDGDGVLDLAASSYNEFRFARNIGGGTFAALQTVAYQVADFTSGWNLAALDLNDDGQPDLVISATCAPYCGNQNFLLVSLNQTRPSVKLRGPSLFPNTGGNTGTVTVSISIPGLSSGATITLTAPGQPDIIGANATVTTYYGVTVLTAAFPLTGAMPGSYNVVIVSGDTILNISSGFTVVEGGAPDISVDLIGRSEHRPGLTQTYYIVVENHGTVDADAASIWLQFPSIISWTAGPDQIPSDVGQIGTDTVLFYDLIGSMPVGSSNTIALQLTTPTTLPREYSFTLEVTSNAR